MASADEWIDLVLRRGGELRKAGVLSIAHNGSSAVFAPADPDADVDDDEAPAEDESPANHWERPESYPTGSVPDFGDAVEKPDEMPEIKFWDD